jgi:hypothetical protein
MPWSASIRNQSNDKNGSYLAICPILFTLLLSSHVILTRTTIRMTMLLLLMTMTMMLLMMMMMMMMMM